MAADRAPLYQLRRLTPDGLRRAMDDALPPSVAARIHRFGADELPEQMLKLDVVAELLDVSKSQVEKLCAKGLIPSVKVAGSRRVRLGDYRAYARNLPPAIPGQRVEADPAPRLHLVEQPAS